MGDRGRRLLQLVLNNSLETAGPSVPLEYENFSTGIQNHNDETSEDYFSSRPGPSASLDSDIFHIYKDGDEGEKDKKELLSLKNVIYRAYSSDSSDLDESQINIATQMDNIVKDNYLMADTHDETCWFGSDYSDEDPTYVPDAKNAMQSDSDSDIIPGGGINLHQQENISVMILNNVLERVWISVEGKFSKKGPCYVPDSDDDLSQQIDPECIALVIKRSLRVPSQTEQIAKKTLQDILDRVWICVKPIKRRKKAQPSEWKINIAKKRKIEGLPYETKGKIRPAKVPKHIQCDKCIFKCTEKFSLEERNSICRNFYEMDFKARKNFILSCIKIQAVKTRRLQKTSNKKDRLYSKKCFFKKNNIEIQVCQKFFMATLCISVDVITEAVSNVDSLGFYDKNDRRGEKSPPNKTKAEDVKLVKEHIMSFPVIESHYCRKDSKKKYLYPDVKSVVKMYRLYEDMCKSRSKNPVSEAIYRKIFTEEFNYSFFKPKKDLCELCTKYEKTDKKEEIEDEYQEHLKRKKICQEAKDADKARANTDASFMSITMDLQAVLQIPKSGESILYYMRKLVLYNFTIYEASLPNNAYCLCWSEINGKKGSCEIGTCLFYYLSQLPEAVTELSIFSDTCSGQNRNQYISALLLWAVQKIDQLKIIEQKFLESGHSHMEVDSMHAAIENASKYISVNSVSDWKNVFRLARATQMKSINSVEGKKNIEIKNYQVKEFKYNEMLDLKKLSATIMKNKNKDNTNETVNWLKIKRIRYLKGDFKIYFNYDMSDNFREIDVTNPVKKTPKTRARQSNPPSVTVPWPEEIEPLYSSQLAISVSKKKDLETMCRKQMIPEEYHGYIQGLKTVSDNFSDDKDDEVN